VKPNPVASLIAACAMAVMVVGCTPKHDLVTAFGRADVSASQTWLARFWLPPGLFGDWEETTVQLSVSAGPSALNTVLPDDLDPSDADLTFVLGAPFDEEIHVRGDYVEESLEWSTTDCALGCFLGVPVEIRSNVELPPGVTWNTRWQLSIAFPEREGDRLGSQGWVVDDDGVSPESWTAAGPEAVELEAGETVVRLLTLSIPDGPSTQSDPIVRVSLSPTEIQDLDAWIPVHTAVDTNLATGIGIPSGSDDWLTASLPGVVERDSLDAKWQLPEIQCSACTRQFAISFRSDRKTTFWWIPIINSIPFGSSLTISSE
jgi:hypothetical protein